MRRAPQSCHPATAHRHALTANRFSSEGPSATRSSSLPLGVGTEDARWKTRRGRGRAQTAIHWPSVPAASARGQSGSDRAVEWRLLRTERRPEDRQSRQEGFWRRAHAASVCPRPRHWPPQGRATVGAPTAEPPTWPWFVPWLTTETLARAQTLWRVCGESERRAAHTRLCLPSRKRGGARWYC